MAIDVADMDMLLCADVSQIQPNHVSVNVGSDGAEEESRVAVLATRARKRVICV